MSSTNEKPVLNPGTSAVLSFLFTGLGQIYNGQIKKGLILMSITSILMTLTVLGALLIGYVFLLKEFFKGQLLLGALISVVSIILIAFIGAFAIYDAYNTAQKKG